MSKNKKDLDSMYRELMNSRGLSGQKMAMATSYSISRIYDFCCGVRDLRTLTVHNAARFAKVLGFDGMDGFYRSVGIDLMEQ